jgi:hypothetical protein
VQADGRQFQLAPLSTVIQRFDVLQLVREVVSAGVDLIVGQGMKHEGIVGIGTVPHADQDFVGHVRLL